MNIEKQLAITGGDIEIAGICDGTFVGLLEEFQLHFTERGEVKETPSAPGDEYGRGRLARCDR